MKTLKNIAVGILGASLFVVSPLWAEELPDANELVAQVNALDDGAFTTRNLHMKMIDRRGKERERDTISLRKYFGEDKKTIIFYQSPTNVKDTAFLTFDYIDNAKDDDQWLYLPALRKVRRISSADRGDYFLGTDFTYEDIKKEGKIAVEDYTFKTLLSEEVDGVLTYKVEAQTVNEEVARELGHSKSHIWIDPEIKIVRKAVYFDLRGKPLKTLVISDVRKVDDIWTRHVLDAVNHKTGHRTIFTFSEVDYQSAVNDRLFNKRSLTKGF